MKRSLISFSILFLSLGLTSLAFASENLVHSSKAIVLTHYCYNYAISKSVNCNKMKPFHGNLYKATYEQYIYNKQGEVVNERFIAIPHNHVVKIQSIRLGNIWKDLIMSRYKNGNT